MAGSTLAAVPQPRVPQLYYFFRTPANKKEPGGVFRPGFDVDTQAEVAFVSLEYEDVWNGLDSCTVVFEDPNKKLVNHPLLKVLETRITFSFGYGQGFGETVDSQLQRTMSHDRTMLLFRIEQNYPQSGKVVSTLRFFSSGMKLSHLRRNFTYIQRDPTKRGKVPVSAKDVIEFIAKANGLDPRVCIPKGVTGSTKEEWKQTNQTDMEFLRQMGMGLRDSEGRTGVYQIMVRDNALIFAPITTDEDTIAIWTYRGSTSPILNFRPKHPADMQKGLGWITAITGYDPRTGGVGPLSRIESSITVLNDEGQDKHGPGQTRGDIGEKGLGLENANAAPRLHRVADPEAERRRTRLEADASVARNNIDRKRTDLQSLGTPPDEIEAQLEQDRADLAATEAKIEAIGTGDDSEIDDLSPYSDVAKNQAENFLRQAQLNALTADLEIFGWPPVESGTAIAVDNVAELFQGKWWLKKVIHRIDRTIGYVTRMDMQKNALGIPNPTAGSQTPKRTPNRDTQTVRVFDVDTNQERVERRSASTVNNMFRQTNRTDPIQFRGQRIINLQSLQTLHSASPADASLVNIPTLINADQVNSQAARNRLEKALGG